MSKRSSQSAVFKGGFLNTLRNTTDPQRNVDWARRATGFATARVREAEELARQAANVEELLAAGAEIGTPSALVTPGQSALHTEFKLIKASLRLAMEADRTVVEIRDAGHHTSPALGQRIRRALGTAKRRVAPMEQQIRVKNALHTDHPVGPFGAGQQKKLVRGRKPRSKRKRR